jgi:hypothetical protein
MKREIDTRSPVVVGIYLSDASHGRKTNVSLEEGIFIDVVSLSGLHCHLVLANVDLAKPLTLLGRPSLEGLVRESYFC